MKLKSLIISPSYTTAPGSTFAGAPNLDRTSILELENVNQCLYNRPNETVSNKPVPHHGRSRPTRTSLIIT